MSHALFDALQDYAGCKSNSAIGRYLKIDDADISRWRNGQAKISSRAILQIYDATGWSIEHIRALLADKSPKKALPAEPKKPPKPVKVDLLTQIAARPKRVFRKTVEDKPQSKRLTVTKTAQWTSTIHRAL